MKNNPNLVSEKAAVQLLKRLFVEPLNDELTLEELYAVAGRADMNAKTNRNWLNGVIAKLRHWHLIETVDKYENSRSKVAKLRVTMVGKTALGWPTEATSGNNPVLNRPMSLSSTDLAKAVAAFKKENPEFYVVFEVKLKEEVPVV